MQIFVSNTAQDNKFAEQVRGRLREWGYPLAPDTQDALWQSSVVLGILTPTSISAPQMRSAWQYALTNGKRLLLLWADDIDETEVPERLIRLQRIDLRDSQRSDTGWQQLQAALASEAKIIPQSNAAATSDITLDREAATNRARMLEKVKVFWIDGVLEQSVHGVAMIELGVAPDDEQVETKGANPWQTVLRHAGYGDYQLPTSANIAEIHRELGREMLILGNPGSGKTTTMLELARTMIVDAENDPSLAIPVIFNLSSWADTRKSLAGWLVDELVSKYQVPRPTAKQWVKDDALALLLDGLDEVDGRYRDACVAAINAYQAAHPAVSLVVCSRIHDYEALSNRLRLNGAIVLQPLDDAQIDRYLASLGGKMQGVRSAMNGDASLRQLAESPLMLSIMTLAFYGVDESELPALGDIDQQRDRLFKTYTERMFERRPADDYSQADTLHYLRWLAGRMVERKQSVFYLENLQADWVAGDWSRGLYRVIGRLSFGMLGGFFVGLVVLLAIFLLAILTGDFDTTFRDARDVGMFSLGMMAFTTGMGALFFSIAGVLSLAIDLMPAQFKPLRRYTKRFVLTTLVGTGVGVLTALVIYMGVIVADWLTDYTSFDQIYLSILERSFNGASAMLVWLGVFALWGIASGALGGSIAATLSSAFNMFGSASTDRDDDAYGAMPDVLSLTNETTYNRSSSYRAILKRALGIGAISVLIAVVTVAVIGILHEVNNWWHYQDMSTILSSMLSAAVLTGLFGIVLTLVGRKWRFITPYVIAGAGFFVYIFTMIALFAVFDGNYPDFVDFVMASFYGTLFVLGGGFAGGLVGRITDDIVSAEALRWSWSWRWTTVGAVASVALALVFIMPNITHLNNWSLAAEIRAQERIDTLTAIIASNDTELAVLEAEYAQMTAAYDSRAFHDAMHDYTIADIHAQMRYPEYAQLPACRYDHTVSSMSRYYPNFRVYGHWDTYFEYWSAQRDIHAAQLQIIGLDEATITEISNQYERVLVCEDINARLSDSAHQFYRRDVQAGIYEGIGINIRIALTIGISILIAGGVVGGLRKTERVEIRTRPNAGMRRTAYTALRVLVAFALVGAAVGMLVGFLLLTIPVTDTGWDADLYERLVPIAMTVGLSIGLSLGVLFGGIDAVVKHAVLRAFLMRKGNIPLNYAKMLDGAAERILLRKVGGGYIFIHRYLLEYFATQETGKRKRKQR